MEEMVVELGVREFRDRLSEIVNGDQFVVVTNNGREIGTFMPTNWSRNIGRARAAAAELAKAQAELRARGIDLDSALASLGMNPFGEPLDED